METKQIMKKYNAWKVDSSYNPIEGTDRIISAPTRRWATNHIADEEKVSRPSGGCGIVKLSDGTAWCISGVGY